MLQQIDAGAVGTVLLETFVSTVLFGLTCHQVFRYFRMFPRDPSQLKKMVSILILLCLSNTIFSMHASYYYLVTKRSQAGYLGNTVWSLKLVMLISDLIAFVTRLFFIHRLFVVTRANLWLSTPVTVFTLTRIGFNIATFSISFLAINSVKSSRAVEAINKLSSGFAALSDTCISGCLSYYLWRTNNGTMEKNKLIDKVILYVVNAGVLSSAVSTAAFICTMSMSTRFASIGLVQLGGAMYANSFMTVVNSRKSLYSPPQAGSFQLGPNIPDDIVGLDLLDGNKIQWKTVVAIHITRETHTVIDNERPASELSMHAEGLDVSEFGSKEAEEYKSAFHQ